MSYDTTNGIVKQENGRLIFKNGFGGISTVEPVRGIPTDELAEARAAIQKMDAKAHNWHR